MTNIGRTIFASTNEEAAQALANAVCGDTIVLKNGIWTDIQLDLGGAGTAEQPITLQAETPGEVILTGASSLTFAGTHLVADGLYFKEGIQPGLDGTNTIVRFLQSSSRCRLTNCAIIDYQSSNREKSFFWVTIDGSGHRVDHCYFKGKDYRGQLLRNMKYSKYNVIDHNYFVDIPPYGINGLEIIQVMGIGSDGEFGSAGGEHVVIEHNLFERADGECEEVISLKSNHDIVRGNTFKDSIGGLVIRSGHNTLVEDNYFLGGNVGGTKGIRITGEDNIVTRNYMSGLQGFALSIMAGEYIEKPLTDEWQPILREGTPLGRVPFYNPSMRNVVTDNVMVHNDGVDLDMGIGYKSGWPGKQRVLLPENNVLTGNVIMREKGAPVTTAVQDPAVMDVTFEPNTYENNFVSVNQERPQIPDNLASYTEITLEKTNAEGILQPVIAGAGIGTLPRTGPLTADDVGPEWTVRKRNQGEPLFQPRDQFATVEQVPWQPNAGVIVLCAGSSDVFVRNCRMKLDVVHRIAAPVEKDGALLVPVRAVAEKAGLRAYANDTDHALTIVRSDSAFTLSVWNSKVVRSGQETVLDVEPELLNGLLYLPAAQLAPIIGKVLVQNGHGLAVLADSENELAAFGSQSLQESAFQLFRVTASSFEKYMTLPPEGRSHGHIPAHTLSDDPATHWTAFGTGQWIRCDLGESCVIGAVGIAFAAGDKAQYAFDLEVSEDGLTWKRLYSGKSSGASTAMESFAVERTPARFFRITGYGSSVGNANRYTRVQIFSADGQPVLR